MGEVFAEQLALCKRKNSDYAADHDPFKNFKASEMYGIPVEKAILVRMSDKMTRIANLLVKEAAVKDESIIDTLSDLSVYSVILRLWLEQKSKTALKLSDAPSEGAVGRSLDFDAAGEDGLEASD